jgi:aminoglycoside phosphotransferase family enzyme/predicted kinase
VTDAHPSAPTPAAVHETHVSYVFLVGDRAAKLKKPVSFPFLDLSTRERREAACHREVELNRRLAPDVYLGVSDLVDVDGRVCDHLVMMRRMPDERRLSRLVATGRADRESMAAVARTIAAFHARADRSPEIAAAGRRDAVRARWDAGFREIAALLPGEPEREIEAEIETLVRRYLDGRAALFDARIDGGCIVDGHGDLLADDVFLLPDGPRVLDCLEFDDTLRFGDVLADVAFLAMDLERLGAPDLASAFLASYRELTGEQHPSSLEDHYVASRAHIRAKVALLRGDPRSGAEARQLLDSTLAHLRRSRVVLTLIGGGPATGKSTLAAGLGSQRGWTVLRSDEIRKDLAGIGHATRAPAAPGEGIYDDAHTAATYAEMLRRADVLLRLGHSVILDATWARADQRAAAARAARESASELVRIRCDAPVPVAVARATRRIGSDDVSDATEEIVRSASERFLPWPEAAGVSTAGEPAAALEAAQRAIARALTTPESAQP